MSDDTDSSEKDGSDSDTEPKEDYGSEKDVGSSRYKRELRKMKYQDINKEWGARLSESFSDISKETAQLIVIKDVKEEIEMVAAILKSQLGVMESFLGAFSPKIKSTAYTQVLKEMLKGGKMKLSRLRDMSERSEAIETAAQNPRFNKFLCRANSGPGSLIIF